MQVNLWSVIERLHMCRSVYGQSLIEATYVQVSLWSVFERLHMCRSVYGQSLIEATYVQDSLWLVIDRGYIRAGQSMVSP